MKRIISRLGAPLAVVLFFCLNQAIAIDVATGPLGSNIQAVRDAATQNPNETRSLGWNLNGTGVNLGQVEGGRPGDPSLFTDPPMFTVQELFHPAVNPGGVGVIGVAIAGTTAVDGVPPVGNAGQLLSGHATQVSGMMAGSNAAGSNWGTAPRATSWSSTLGGRPAGWFAADAVVAGSEWARNLHAARFINHSYGLATAGSPQLGFNYAAMPPATPNGQPNGNHLMTLYMDWSAVRRDILHVIAGDENTMQNPPLRRIDVLGIDGFNTIVVGATSQRVANGRFDEVANWSNSNVTADNRLRTDVVAPGGTSYSVDLVVRNMAGVELSRRTVNVFPANNAANEVQENFVDNVANGDLLMPTLVDNLPAVPGPDGILDTATMRRSGGTSFAAPQVTGLAGLMQEYATANFGGLSQLTTKAAIINSASKHVLSKPIDTNGDFLADQAGKSWTQRYEDRNTGSPFVAFSRDADIGFGQANGISAIKQIANGGGSSRVSIQSSSVAAQSDHVFNLNVGGETLKPGSLITGTLTWNRTVTHTNDPNPNLAQLQNVNNYANPNIVNNASPETRIADLDLWVRNRGTGNMVAASLALIDNVEHVYFNVREEGHYDLVVRNASNTTTSFGLAFSAGTSNGIAFTVENNAQGKQAPSRLSDTKWPNDVNSLGFAGQGGFDIGGEIFASSLNGTNMQRVSGALGTKSRVGPHLAVPAAQNLLDNSKGALGLVSGDQLSGLSWGRDGSLLNGIPSRSVLTFSVDVNSFGWGAVAAEAATVSHPGDIFKTPALDPFGAHNTKRLQPAALNSNAIHIQEHQLGLWAPNAGASLLPNALPDNLRDFEFDNILDYTDTDGDGMINNDAYFALDRFSPTVLNGGASASDILISLGQDPGGGFDLNAPGGGFNFNVFAPAAVIGLQPGGLDPVTRLPVGDAIDALVLSRTVLGIPHYVPLLDQALFSLDPLSASVLAGFASPAAIYYTDFARPFQPNIPWTLGGSLFASPGMLGLGVDDNIDGLDIFAVPEPLTIALVAMLLMLLVPQRWLTLRSRRADA